MGFSWFTHKLNAVNSFPDFYSQIHIEIFLSFFGGLKWT